MNQIPDFPRRQLIGAAFALTGLAAAPASLCAPRMNYRDREEVIEWAKDFSQKQSVPYEWTIKALSAARHSQTSARIMQTPSRTHTASPRNWYAHRQRILTDDRILNGRRFLEDNANFLAEAYKRWRVPPEIITAIIGVETGYGKNRGRIRVLDALCTLSFDATRRAERFRMELGSFLVWCYRTKTVPSSVKGSFAGAIGLCQFLPSNILRCGVDLDGDGVVDLYDSRADAIGSVANYLHMAGWVPDLPIAIRCQASPELKTTLEGGGIKPVTTIANALDAGVDILEKVSLPSDTPVFLVDLPVINEDKSASALYRLATRNFQAILHYNRSYFYAETVRELALSLSPQA